MAKSTARCSEAKISITSGVVTRQPRVEIAVSAIERGVLPWASQVSTFDMVPPGTAATSIRPTAMPGGTESARLTARASSGTHTSCVKSPTPTPIGTRSTAAKSAGRSVAPMPSMASASCTAANQYSCRT